MRSTKSAVSSQPGAEAVAAAIEDALALVDRMLDVRCRECGHEWTIR
jgi:hypothetical protein